MKGQVMSMSPSTRVVGICSLVSLAAGLFGFDTGSIGAISVMPEFEASFGILSPLVRGLVVAIILIPSAFSGIFAGMLSDRISRKKTISLGCAIFAVGSAISAGSESLGVLMFGRCFAGSGEGLFLSCVGVYICEVSPKHLRGKMIVIVQLMTTGAIAAGFFCCYATVNIPSSYSWRLPFIVQTITASSIAVATPFLPYSPRWLVSKGRRSEAEEVLDSVLGVETRGSEERLEMFAAGPAAGKSSFWAIFEKGVRGRTALGAFLNVFQQLSGIDFVLFFAPLLFAQAGLNAHTAAFLASGVTGLVLLATVIVGAFFIDKVGRRPLFLWGGLAVSTCLFTLGTLYATGAAKGPVGKWFVIAFIELFAITFSGSWSIVVRLYSSEIQPYRTRASATAFGQGANQAVNFVVAVTGPAFLAESSFGPYYLYGAFSLFATFVAYLYMPETSGKSLESIDTTFDGSPYAVDWPQVFLPGSRVGELRNRRTSRANSSHLQGESRAEFRNNLMELNVLGSAIEE